jgi:outer membrane protein assembly factor BamD
MMQRSNRISICPSSRSSISDFRTALTTGFAAAALLAATLGAHAQETAPAADPAAQSAAPAPPQATQPQNDLNLSNQKQQKTRKAKEDKVVESKETKKEDKKVKKDITLATMDTKLPDKQLYDKAEDAIKHGRFDVGRLDLQTLLNTYSESQYMMRAKLAIADSWYKEGGTAALTQAEQEYKDFITFFPNAPEAAEAQMRVGDIYFRQMDKPDRDYSTTVKAEQEYRLMLQQFPDSPLVPQAQQRLREVQEVLANREANIASFYGERQPPNYAAAIARFQTVVDSYPLYSHMDDVLIGLGDAYESEAKFFRAMRLPPAANKSQQNTFEAGKARLEKIYDDEAQAAYDKVVLEHAAAPHVEDAKDRLVGMGLPVPTPSAEQVAASAALENSRGQYTLSKRAIGIFMHQADTVPAATIGAPPLEDPALVSAAAIAKKGQIDYVASMMGKQAPAIASAKPAATADATATAAQAPAPAPLQFQDVPTDTTGASGSSAVTNVQVSSPSSAPRGSMGIEIVNPGSGAQTPITAPATPPAFPGTAPANTATTTTQTQPATDNGGIGPVGPPNATALAPIEKPAAAPEAINDAANTKQPAAQPPVNGKKPKVACDKSDESCSKHKPKKGLAKLNPF